MSDIKQQVAEKLLEHYNRLAVQARWARIEDMEEAINICQQHFIDKHCKAVDSVVGLVGKREAIQAIRESKE